MIAVARGLLDGRGGVSDDGGEFEVQYDKLAIATGAQGSTFNIPGVEEYAPPLRDVADASAIKDKLIIDLRSSKASGTPSATLPVDKVADEIKKSMQARAAKDAKEKDKGKHKDKGKRKGKGKSKGKSKAKEKDKDKDKDKGKGKEQGQEQGQGQGKRPSPPYPGDVDH